MVRRPLYVRLARDAAAGLLEFFAKVRSHGTPKTLGAPPYEVTLDFGRVRHGDKTIVELAESFCKDYDGSKGDLSTDWRTQRWAILSLVGPVLSVDVHRYRESFKKAQKKGGGLYKKDGELPLLP